MQGKYLILIFCFLIAGKSQGQELYNLYLSKIKQNYVQGDIESVKYYIEKGKSKFPDSSIFYLQSADLYYFDQDYKNSLVQLNIASKLGATGSGLYLSKAVAYHNLKVLDSAAVNYTNYLKIVPLDTFVQINFGILQFERKNYKETIKLISKYVNDKTYEFPRKQVVLIEAYRKTKEFDSMLVISNLIIELDSSSFMGYRYRAESHELLNQNFKACEDYLKAFELGDYSIKEKFDSFDCYKILDMDSPDSPYKYPPPPPEITIEK